MTQTLDQLQALATLTCARFEAERAKLHAFFEVEAALRRDLARLEAHAREMAHLAPAQLGQVRAIGADIAWQGWQIQKRSEVNLRLALHLAQKELALARLRRAYGKMDAARNVLENAKGTARHARHAAAQSETLDLAVMAAMRPENLSEDW